MERSLHMGFVRWGPRAEAFEQRQGGGAQRPRIGPEATAQEFGSRASFGHVRSEMRSEAVGQALERLRLQVAVKYDGRNIEERSCRQQWRGERVCAILQPLLNRGRATGQRGISSRLTTSAQVTPQRVQRSPAQQDVTSARPGRRREA